MIGIQAPQDRLVGQGGPVSPVLFRANFVKYCGFGQPQRIVGNSAPDHPFAQVVRSGHSKRVSSICNLGTASRQLAAVP
jgi:hypothetical protein